jgi:ubiquitin-protein ligase
MPPWWGTRSEVSKRLRLEYEAMRAAFGATFRLIVPQRESDLLFWQGTVVLNLAGVRWKKYRPDHLLKILYPADYPHRPAEAYVLEPDIYSEKHQYEDGQLCLFNPKDGEHYGWNPSGSTAVTVTGWAIQWLYAYYTWRDTGEWPGIEERILDRDDFPRRPPRPTDDE